MATNSLRAIDKQTIDKQTMDKQIMDKTLDLPLLLRFVRELLFKLLCPFSQRD